MQNSEKQIERVVNWHKSEWNEALNNNHPQIRNYVRTYKLNEEQLMTKEMKKRIIRLCSFIKGVKPIVQNDIMSFFG